MKKLLIFALGMILFISCAEPLENYKGYIVAKEYFINENRVLLKYFDVNTMKYKYVKVWALRSQINQYNEKYTYNNRPYRPVKDYSKF